LAAQAGQNPSTLGPKHCSVEKGPTELPYPESLKGSGIQGTVALEAIIGTNGCAGDIRVVKKLHPELDMIAKRTVSSWKFEPAMKDGKPVIVKVRIEVRFHDRSGETPN